MDLAARFPERVSDLIVANSSARDSGLLRIAPKSLLELVIKPKEKFHNKLADLLLRMISIEENGAEYSEKWEEIRSEEGFYSPLVPRSNYWQPQILDW